ncbi:host-nuclease inhibitor Gam family protein [Paenibacillus ginsengarvi]|uniref:Uncharacterized protein n=1 Tax=Paenibacillus ginsengarvi TaxID=400777 RepID=A0A3B0CNW6_9BACL|nr:host-nuclease inhibitor Gam family protein [Paenibacillus ginsengarvi]RKN86782.1 hypothetical protein D7M11_02150 [Paenibacillus ginsengarvi]
MNGLQQVELDELNEFFRDVLGLPGIESADELENPDVKGRFKINNLEELNWVMRKISAFKVTIASTEDLAEQEVKRINDWKKRQIKPAEQGITFFSELVREWANGQRAKNAKFKSQSTPYGRVTFQKQQPEWLYRDESQTADFLLSQGLTELAEVNKVIANKTEFKKKTELQRNVFVKGGVIVDFGAENELTGDIDGMEYAKRGEYVLSLETGAIVEDVIFKATVAAIGKKVVPGVEVNDRPEAVVVKPEV